MIVESSPSPSSHSKKDGHPVYEERCRVSLTIPISSSEDLSAVSPPPPLPSVPPSKERIKRIPSYLKPTPAPRSMSATLPRARLKTPPPPPPVTNQFDTLPVSFRSSSTSSSTGGLPRIPNIPVPDVPFIPLDDDNCYDEIMLVTPSSNTCIPTHQRLESEYTYESQSTDFSRPEPPRASGSEPNSSRRAYPRDEEIFDEAEEELLEEQRFQKVPEIKERFLSSTLQRNPKSSKRMSSMELEKLFRFKSELQLNLSKKVGALFFLFLFGYSENKTRKTNQTNSDWRLANYGRKSATNKRRDDQSATSVLIYWTLILVLWWVFWEKISRN